MENTTSPVSDLNVLDNIDDPHDIDALIHRLHSFVELNQEMPTSLLEQIAHVSSTSAALMDEEDDEEGDMTTVIYSGPEWRMSCDLEDEMSRPSSSSSRSEMRNTTTDTKNSSSSSSRHQCFRCLHHQTHEQLRMAELRMKKALKRSQHEKHLCTRYLQERRKKTRQVKKEHEKWMMDRHQLLHEKKQMAVHFQGSNLVEKISRNNVNTGSTQ